VPNLPKIADAAGPRVIENATKPAYQPLPLGGPSVAGLHQPGVNQSSPSRIAPIRPSPNPPSISSLRENTFSGMDSFSFEPEPQPEESKTGAWRVLLLLTLLAALGVAGWWTYTNYIGAAENRKPDAVASTAGEASAEKPSTKSADHTAAATPAPPPANDAISSQPVTPSAEIAVGRAEKSPENASAAPKPDRKIANARTKPEAKPSPLPKMKTAPANKGAAKHEPIVPAAKPSNPPAPTTADTGDVAFHKGEAYLYGRGVKENCDEAVKNLKAASAKSNAKARSAFGTMYATGHCVPRDLPTSYLWFALALRADPNNQILEKDLSAVWNQMTPPERQMATKMKQ
jgi:hypothetical protein